MNRCTGVALLWLLICACNGESHTTSQKTELNLTRSNEGRLALALSDAPAGVQAAEVELTIAGDGQMILEDARAPSGIALDSVRVGMLDEHRARLFVSDMRGTLLPSTGIIATLLARSPLSIGNSSAMLSIARAVLVDAQGQRVPTGLGRGLMLQ